ncbi:MAG: hypothetical protein GOV00_01730 [Candidatus Altiarchaeota archaeon]|nr:hypothetical protein [Candidatus Altiarchaeota archaeon]
MVALETVLFVIFGLFLAFYLSIRLRKGGRWIKQRGVIGAGIVFTVVGALLLLLAYFSQKVAFLSMFEPYLPLYIRVGVGVAVLGIMFIIIGEFKKTGLKEKGLEIEAEKRRYIERIRSALTVDEAEDIAKRHIKEVGGRNTKLIASKKEFKRWAVYLKDEKEKYYRVVINQKGRIEEWEAMEEIPSYILSP